MNYEKVKTAGLTQNALLEKRLYHVVRLTASSDMSLHQFRLIFVRCSRLKVTFLRDEEMDVGFIYYAIYHLSQTTLVIRPGMGILPKYRNKAIRISKFDLAKSIFLQKLINPFKHVYITSVVANPLMYSGICTYWAQTYPQPDILMPDRYAQVLEAVKKYFDLETDHNYVLPLSFRLLIGHDDMQRMNVQNKYMRFFFSCIPDRRWDKGILTISPVNLPNLYHVVMTGIGAGR